MWQRRDVSSFVVIVSLLAEEVDDQTLTTEEKMMMVQLPSVRVAVVVLPFAPKKKEHFHKFTSYTEKRDKTTLN
jgi:hypothetical protein